MTAIAKGDPPVATPAHVFEFTTTIDAAVDARALFGARMKGLDRIIDLVAFIAGAILIAVGEPIGFVLVIGAVVFLVLGRQIQGFLVGYRGRSMLGKRTLVRADDDALNVSNELASMDIPWSSITALRSDSKTVIFVRDRLLIFYMPSSAFSSREEQSDFVGFAQGRIASESRVSRG